MKLIVPSFTARILAAGIFGSLALAGCEKPTKIDASPKPEPRSEKPPSLSTPNMVTPPDLVATPVDRTIIDNNGRSLEVRILARSGTHARMVRMTDGLKFDIPIRDLSEDDQRFINRIPETPDMGSLTPRTYSRKNRAAPPYIKTREESIARLEIKLAGQRAEIDSVGEPSTEGKSSPRVRMLQKEADKTNAEIVRLKAQIEDYRSQNDRPR